MHILQLAHGIPPESVGGVEQHVDGLSRALALCGHQVHIYARTTAHGHAQGDLLPTLAGNPAITRAVFRWEGVRDLASMYDCIPMAATLGRFLDAQRDLGIRFDVAHVHHLTGMSTDSLAVLQRAEVPTVLTLHDYWSMCPRGQMWHRREEVCEQVEPQRCGECLAQTFPGWLKPETGAPAAAALHDRARAVLAQATKLVIPSARALAPFLKLGVPRERITVVENGVDTEALRMLPLPACGPGPLRLGYLGTVMPSKGLHVLLEAVLRQPRGSVELHIHGNVVPYHGDDSYGPRCFGRLTPGCGVHYHGPYATGELPAILGTIDVVCAPALWQEAFGLTVREASAAGRPVLASRIGGLQDAVIDGQEGRVLAPGDVDAWALAIGEFANDRAAVRTMAARSRPRARGFSAMADDLIQVYGAARTAGP